MRRLRDKRALAIINVRLTRFWEGNLAETYSRWDVTEYLQTVEEVRCYLEMCAEEDPGDGSLIRAALCNIVNGRNFDRVAHEIGISGEGLYSAMSTDGDPSFVTVMRVIRALGMELRIVPADGVATS
jgi:probable addiction module antidote protein